MSIMPIYDLDDNKNELFGFLYLKNVMYIFTNGNIFSFNDTVEKFLQKLYEGIDEEKPLGKERISIIDLEKSDYDLKTIFEMMSVSPERKIIVKDKTDLGLITLSSIFKSVINSFTSLFNATKLKPDIFISPNVLYVDVPSLEFTIPQSINVCKSLYWKNSLS